MFNVVHEIHRLPTAVIMRATVCAGSLDLRDLREEFARWATRFPQHLSWQAAWNSWTGATEQRVGVLHLRARCHRCHGRRFTVTAAGAGFCAECRSRGTVMHSVRARWQEPPNTAA